ncbi:efflux RND transporter periplasmic adaptor subunit [Deinococcus sp.]|uniref:efflux RND transporter periplasmic adaptor subunit n=1 Tax=Deinococcus sp. TaxID=47478 RepID=UPI0025E5D964|nr:efflux RND transporter periplasmic adaptor subunit [Deinococcus sp.]
MTDPRPTPEPIVQVRGPKRRASSAPGTPRLKADKPRSQWPLLIYSLLAVLVLAGGALLLLRPRTNVYTLRSYQAATVQKADLIETEITVGTLSSGDVRPVSPLTEGTVQSVLVQAGQDVQAGQLLARLASPDLEAARVKARDALLVAQDTQAGAVRTAQSALSEAGRAQQAAAAALPAARLALSSAQNLYAIGGVSQLDLNTAQVKAGDAERAIQTAEGKRREAQGAVQDAKNAGVLKLQAVRDDLKRAEAALARLNLRSPIAGRVSDLALKPGQRVTAGSVALNVASLKQVSVVLQLGEALAGRVKVGQAAKITVGEQTYPGEIVRVATQASAGSGSGNTQTGPTVQAEAAFKQLPAGLRLGSSASVEVRVANHKGVLTLPRAAFLSTGGEALAYVLNAEKAERREVSFGAQNDTQVEVRSGLQVGERVITSSYESFKDQPTIQAPKSGEIGAASNSGGQP